MSTTSFFIYGSCVSRDAFRFAREGSFRLVDYYARSSLVSVFAPPVATSGFCSLEKITSNFKRRAVERDLNKTLLKDLVHKRYDILMIDFIDERLHLLRLDKEKSYLTLSSEFRETQTPITRKNTILGFSPERNTLWQSYWGKFVTFCTRHHILDRIRINKVFYSKYNTDGDIVAQYTSEQIDEINNSLETMYYRVSNDIPDDHIINYEAQLFVANKKHLWGESPFYYIDAMYQTPLDQLGIPVAESPVAP